MLVALACLARNRGVHANLAVSWLRGRVREHVAVVHMLVKAFACRP